MTTINVQPFLKKTAVQYIAAKCVPALFPIMQLTILTLMGVPMSCYLEKENRVTALHTVHTEPCNEMKATFFLKRSEVLTKTGPFQSCPFFTGSARNVLRVIQLPGVRIDNSPTLLFSLAAYEDTHTNTNPLVLGLAYRHAHIPSHLMHWRPHVSWLCPTNGFNVNFAQPLLLFVYTSCHFILQIHLAY